LFKDVTTLFENPYGAHSDSADMFKNSSRMLLETLSSYTEELAGQQELLDKLSTLASHVAALSHANNVDEQRPIFQWIITLVMDISYKIQNASDSRISSILTNSSISDGEELQLYGGQLLEFISATKHHCSIIKLNACAMAMKFDLQNKFPDKPAIAQTLVELLSLLSATVDAYAQFCSKNSHPNKE
jgi:hypothetical protein